MATPTTATSPKWAQKTITLSPLSRGCHLITPKYYRILEDFMWLSPQRTGSHVTIFMKLIDFLLTVLKEIGSDLSDFRCGLAHFFLQHTSASLTINENYDTDVRDDTETFLNTVVPEGRSAPWKHTLEGTDDMPAHIKSSLFGCSLTVPISNGKLNMGTWQGIWLCEHRDYPTPRKVVVTLNGI